MYSSFNGFSLHHSAKMILGLCLILSVALAYGDMCGCRKHPQELVCDADFVIKGKILSREITSPSRYRKVANYKVDVLVVFKGNDVITTGHQIISRRWAGKCQLEVGKKYLITGDKSWQQLQSEDCQWIVKWRDLTSFQKQGLTDAYTDNCHTCRITTDIVKVAIGRLPVGPLISSRGNECVFQYGTDRGRERAAGKSCVRGCEGQRGCSWVLNSEYEPCSNDDSFPELLIN